MPQISVIIPHYNSPEKLIRLLNSIEDSNEIEVIIVDDKSTISLSIIEQVIWKRKNTILLKNESSKKGAGVSRNLGMKRAHGTWLLFADADDYFLSNIWSTLKEFSTRTEEVIFFPPTSIVEDSQELSNRHGIYENLVKDYLTNQTVQSELALRAKYVVPWSKMIKRELVIRNHIEFDEIPVSNDVMFSVKTGLLAQEVTASEEVIYCATKDSKTLSTTVSFDKYQVRTNTYLNYHHFLQSKLTRKEYLNLELYGGGWLYQGLSQGIPSKYILQTGKKMRKEKIQLVPFNASLFTRILNNLKKSISERKFLN